MSNIQNVQTLINSCLPVKITMTSALWPNLFTRGLSLKSLPLYVFIVNDSTTIYIREINIYVKAYISISRYSIS